MPRTFRRSSWRQVPPISGATDLEPVDRLGITHAPMMRVPIAVLQSTNSVPAVYPPTAAFWELSPAAADTTVFPSPAVLERLTPEQRDSFLRVWHRLPTHLRQIPFDLHSL